MKFYSYTNKNRDYTKAVVLKDVCSLHLIQGEGTSVIRFFVRIEYEDGRKERFHFLERDEAKQVYEDILKLLNQ